MAAVAALSPVDYSVDFPAVFGRLAPSAARRRRSRLPRSHREAAEEVLQGWTLCDGLEGEDWVLCEAEAQAGDEELAGPSLDAGTPLQKSSNNAMGELDPALKAEILRQMEAEEEEEDEEDAQEAAKQQGGIEEVPAAGAPVPEKPEALQRHRTRAERKALWRLKLANEAEKEGLNGKSEAADDKAEEVGLDRKLQRGVRRHERRNRREC